MTRDGRRWFLGLAGVGVGAWGFSSLFSSEADADEAVNRVWLERVPRSTRDMVSHFVLVRRGGRRVGVTGKSSRWRHQVELFQWALERERLSLVYPQTRNKQQLTATVKQEGPRPFDRTLILTDPDGEKTTYYSRKGLIIRPGEAMEIDDDVPELSALAASIASQVPAVDESS